MPAHTSHPVVGPEQEEDLPPSSPTTGGGLSLQQQRKGPLAGSPLILKRIDAVPGYVGGFTVAAVLDAPAEEVLRFLSSPGGWSGVLRSVAGVEDVESAAPGEISFSMRQVVRVLGTHHTPSFRMRSWTDPGKGQIRFRQLQPSGVIREMEGVHAVVALLPGADPAAQLQQATDDLLLSLGVINGVAASGGVAAAERSPGAAVHGAASAPPLALRELNGVPPLPSLPGLPSQRPKRCIVVLHHKVKTRWMPPGVSRLLKGHLLSAHSRNLDDMLTKFGGGRG